LLLVVARVEAVVAQVVAVLVVMLKQPTTQSLQVRHTALLLVLVVLALWRVLKTAVQLEAHQVSL
jgi:hypothetical protein